MSDLQSRLRNIEANLHTLETATPRNAAAVGRGEFSVVGEGNVILEQGGTVSFDEGGSAISANFSLEDRTGWQIGTERRGSSVVVINDAPSESLTVTTSNSSVVFETIPLTPEETINVPLQGASSMIIQLFTVSERLGSVVMGGSEIKPTGVIKSQKPQWAYSYMETLTSSIDISTDISEVSVRVARLSVNNAS